MLAVFFSSSVESTTLTMSLHNPTVSFTTGNLSTVMVPTHIKDFTSFTEEQLLDFLKHDWLFQHIHKGIGCEGGLGTLKGFLEHAQKQKKLHEVMNRGPDGNGPWPMQLGVSLTQSHCYTILS